MLILSSGLVQAQNLQDDLQLDADSITSDSSGNITAIEAKLVDNEGHKLSAAKLEYLAEQQQVIGSGGVEVIDPSGLKFTAKEVSYLIGSGKAWASGEVLLSGVGSFSLMADQFNYSFADRSGRGTQIVLTDSVTNAKLIASAANVDAQGYALEQVSFTTCKNDEPDWQLQAEELQLINSNVVARNVSLEFIGVPFFYLPYLSYSIDNTRKSGFLAPQIQFGDHSEIEIPYYFNLAPNADATAKLRVIKNRGALIDLKTRLLRANSYSEVELAVIDDSKLNKLRDRWRIEHQVQITPNWNFAIAAQGVSDDNYNVDLLDGELVAQRHFPRSFAVNYQGQKLQGSLLFDSYQTIKPSPGKVERPYNKLPQLDLLWHDELAAGVELEAFGQVSRFRRSEAELTNVRSYADVSLQKRYAVGSASYDLRVGVVGANYSQTNNWTSAYASFGSRINFSRQTMFRDQAITQILTPRLLVGVLPKQDFAGVPLYDTARADFSVEHLYEMNPFVGGDRFGDSPFVTYGLETSFWLDETNRPLLTALLAQRYLLRASKATVTGESPAKKGFSNALFDLRISPTEQFDLVGQIEWNPDHSWEKLALEAKQIEEDKAYYLRYSRLEDNKKGSIGAGLLWIGGGNYQLGVEANYNLEEKRTDRIAGGVRIQNGECNCWALDLFVSRNLVDLKKNETNFYIQMSFEGLAKLGSDRFDELKAQLRKKI